MSPFIEKIENTAMGGGALVQWLKLPAVLGEIAGSSQMFLLGHS